MQQLLRYLNVACLDRILESPRRRLCAVSEQRPDDRRVSTPTSALERIAVVLGMHAPVRTGTGGQQGVRDARMPCAGAVVQRRAPFRGPQIHVALQRHQQLHDAQVAAVGREVQGAFPLVGQGIHFVLAQLDELGTDRFVASVRCAMQGRVATGVGRGEVRHDLLRLVLLVQRRRHDGALDFHLHATLQQEQ
eukprot:scaffold7358_cov252-Pinguiococcus_pyrenoidosus.AAC.38